MPYSHSSGSNTTRRHFVLSYSSLLQSQDSLHHNMACIIPVSVYIYIWSISPRTVLEHNRWSTRPRRLRELLEVHHLEAVAVKRWSPPSTHRHTSRDFQTEFMWKSSSGSRRVAIAWEDMILPGVEDHTQLRGSTILWTEWVRPNVGKDKVCIFIVW